jgi:bifunctional DNase/RNase
MGRLGMATEMKVKAVGFIPSMHEFAVILVDLENHGALTIAITPLEAKALLMKLNNAAFHRPTSHDLIRNILGAFDAEIVRIEMINSKDNTYYALIQIKSQDKNFAIYSRPSDAIAIALGANVPIYVAEKALCRAKAIELSKDTDEDQMCLSGELV